MSDKYTYADVIIDPDDPRVEIGKEYYFGDPARALLAYANEDTSARVLESVKKESDYPFREGIGYYSCIIRKKESEKKYVPFDLSDPEVRKSLRERWIKADCGEYQISGFRSIDGEDGEEWEVAVAFGFIPSETLLNRWTFEDGTPCGKLVEEDDKWKEIAE